MKKKILIFMMLAISIFSLSACGKSEVKLADYLIEERNNLFVACDELYHVSLSSGLRENDYNFDGIITDKVDFGVLTLSRLDNCPLANDNYAYVVKINDKSLSGFLIKNETNNTYTVDLGVQASDDAVVSVEISFTGYTFKKDMENISSSFGVDKTTALSIASNELQEDLKNLMSDKNVKIEVVMKILKDYSSQDTKTYYWYVGAISTNGDTLGILINANNGEIIAKKV